MKRLSLCAGRWAAGLITHKEVLPFLDEEVLSRANQYHIPIIAIDDDYGFTALNYSIIDLILKDEIAPGSRRKSAADSQQ